MAEPLVVVAVAKCAVPDPPLNVRVATIVPIPATSPVQRFIDPLRAGAVHMGNVVAKLAGPYAATKVVHVLVRRVGPYVVI